MDQDARSAGPEDPNFRRAVCATLSQGWIDPRTQLLELIESHGASR